MVAVSIVIAADSCEACKTYGCLVKQWITAGLTVYIHATGIGAAIECIQGMTPAAVIDPGAHVAPPGV